MKVVLHAVAIVAVISTASAHGGNSVVEHFNACYAREIDASSPIDAEVTNPRAEAILTRIEDSNQDEVVLVATQFDPTRVITRECQGYLGIKFTENGRKILFCKMISFSIAVSGSLETTPNMLLKVKFGLDNSKVLELNVPLYKMPEGLTSGDNGLTHWAEQQNVGIFALDGSEKWNSVFQDKGIIINLKWLDEILTRKVFKIQVEPPGVAASFFTRPVVASGDTVNELINIVKKFKANA